MSCCNKWHRKWLHTNWPVKLLFQKTIAFFVWAPQWRHGLKQKTGGGVPVPSSLSLQSENKVFVGMLLAVGLGLCTWSWSSWCTWWSHMSYSLCVAQWSLLARIALSIFSSLPQLDCVVSGLNRSTDMTFKGKSAASITGNEWLPWALSITGHLGLCLFPRSVSEMCIKANQAERGGSFAKQGSFTRLTRWLI